MSSKAPVLIVIAACGLLAVAPLDAQRGGGARGQAPPTPKADAAIDLTGTWTAVITEDWALRMVTPRKGDYTRVPMTPASRKIADAWDPARDEAAGEQCRGYGAPGIMRLPGRLRISWQDDQTLKMELEAGTQTRLFHFSVPGPKGPGLPEPTDATWQGESRAQWQYTVNPPRTGELKVLTSRLRAGDCLHISRSRFARRFVQRLVAAVEGHRRSHCSSGGGGGDFNRQHGSRKICRRRGGCAFEENGARTRRKRCIRGA